jgi:hypothetical protein
MSTQDRQILNQIIARAEGDDRLLSELAIAIGSGEHTEVQRVIAEHMGVYLSEEKARQVVGGDAARVPTVVAYTT